MERKGYLTAEGRVVQALTPDCIAELRYDVQRYNLRRLIVTRTWYGLLLPELDYARPWRDKAHAAGDTRREVIEQLLARYDEVKRHGSVNGWCRVEGIPLRAEDCRSCRQAHAMGVATEASL